jgi:hypothetical protein
VWPENWRAAQLFLACGTQWEMEPVGLGCLFYQGLNYSKVRDVMEMMGITDQKEMLLDIRVMEAEAKVVLNEKVKRSMK